MLRQLRALVGLAFVCLSLPVLAESRVTVEWVSGSPQISTGSEFGARTTSVVTSGRSYLLPIDIQSGVGDQAILRLGESTIHVAPNSAMHIPAPEANLIQKAIQTLGSVMFDIAPQDAARFQVDTPYLVAVVKGTVFNILVDDEKSAVVLQSGSLQVQPFESKDAFTLGAGDVLVVDWQGQVQQMRLEQNTPTPAMDVVLEANSPHLETDVLADEIGVLLSFFQKSSAAGGREQF